MLLLQCLGAAFAGASCLGLAFRRPLWVISVGYGAAMTLQSCLAFARRQTLDSFAKAHLALVGLYGVRLAGFILWRDRLPSYQAIKAKHEGHADKLSPATRAYMMGSCVLLYTAMFLPAFYSSGPGAKAAAGSLHQAVSATGLVLAGMCLAWEALADVTQQLYYKGGGKSPCRVGPWRVSHQANYQGEIGFWVSGYLAGLRSYPTPLDALYSSVGVAGIVWVLTHESKRRQKRQSEAATASAPKVEELPAKEEGAKEGGAASTGQGTG